tara:strand:- start:356 stop:535 length:180 start_codon:yes stop_codon:yes gene_type:complete
MYTFPKTVNGSEAIRLVVLDAPVNVPTAEAMSVVNWVVLLNSFGEKGPTTLYFGVRLAI